MSLQYIFARPDYVDKAGDIFPIRLIDYEAFEQCSSILYISKNHFKKNPYPLLFLIFMSAEHLGFKNERELIKEFEKLFSLVARKDFKFVESDDNAWFECEYEEDGVVKKNYINVDNYDAVRTTITKQNLLFEQKIYKTERTRRWAEKALKTKQKKAPKITLEDIVTTVSVSCGKNYSDLQYYTIYQLYSDFYRLRKIAEYDASVHFLCAGAKDLKLQDFAESLDLYHNPYDDLFVDSSKLSGLNKVMQGK